MIFAIILSIFATPTSTFQNSRSVENENDLQNVNEEVWGRTHTGIFRPSRSRSSLGMELLHQRLELLYERLELLQLLISRVVCPRQRCEVEWHIL
jgi:LytS/YehU family sensor histidine kinase